LENIINPGLALSSVFLKKTTPQQPLLTLFMIWSMQKTHVCRWFFGLEVVSKPQIRFKGKAQADR